MAVLNEEQTMIRDSAKSWVQEKSPVTAFRKLRDSGNPDGFDRAIWRAMKVFRATRRSLLHPM